MGIDLDDRLVESATKYAVTINEYGDTVYGATSTSACLYRDISATEEAANRGDTRIDGLLWFAADEDVARTDIYYHSSEGYLQIIKVTKAKRLLIDDTTQFIKCEVAKQRQLS